MNQRNILIVAATAGELAPLTETAGLAEVPAGKIKSILIDRVPVDLLITGPGMVATAYGLGRIRGLHEYTLVVNAGIAGSFSTSRKIGEVLLIAADCFIELGCAMPTPFRPMYSMPMAQPYRPAWVSSENVIYNDPPALESLSTLSSVNGITVNYMSGGFPLESQLPENYSVETESMEGAAFFWACKMAGIPSVQIRSVSNYIGSTEPCWNIPLAVKSLNETLLALIHELS